MVPPLQQVIRALSLTLLAVGVFLSAGRAFAWTTSEIRQAPMEAWVIQDIQTDPQSDGSVAIRYRVTEPTYVLLRAHAKFSPFPIVRQILPRALRQPGVYEELWDGRDDSGHPVEYLQWQLVVRGEPVNFTPTQEEIEGALSEPPHPVILRTTHHLHNPARCGVFQLTLTNLPEGSGLTGETLLAVRQLGSFRGYSESLGIGLQAFVENRQVGEIYLPPEQAGAEEFSFPLDLTPVPTGEHLLRVVMTDFADHYGTVSVKFRKP